MSRERPRRSARSTSTGATPGAASISLPPGTLVPGDNVVELVAPGAGDVSLEQYVRAGLSATSRSAARARWTSRWTAVPPLASTASIPRARRCWTSPTPMRRSGSTIPGCIGRAGGAGDRQRTRGTWSRTCRRTPLHRPPSPATVPASWHGVGRRGPGRAGSHGAVRCGPSPGRRAAERRALASRWSTSRTCRTSSPPARRASDAVRGFLQQALQGLEAAAPVPAPARGGQLRSSELPRPRRRPRPQRGGADLGASRQCPTAGSWASPRRARSRVGRLPVRTEDETRRWWRRSSDGARRTAQSPWLLVVRRSGNQ